MVTLRSAQDTDALITVLRKAYALRDASVQLHRDWIGYVYTVHTQASDYIFKLYRPFHTPFALHSIGILQYLAAQGFPAAQILPTATGEDYVTVETPQGTAIAMLYPMMIDQEPDAERDLLPIAAQAGALHRVMAGYPGALDRHGKAHFIGRYLRILERIAFPQDKLFDLKEYGDRLWEPFTASAPGFCHGDLHCGNMLKDAQGRYWLFDFDASCLAHPSADIATMVDRTDYFHLRKDGLIKTQRALERFAPAYEAARGKALTEQDRRAVYAFIAIRHYDIQATITDCQGFSMQNLENQHRWLMDWRALCECYRLC